MHNNIDNYRFPKNLSLFSHSVERDMHVIFTSLQGSIIDLPVKVFFAPIYIYIYIYR